MDGITYGFFKSATLYNNIVSSNFWFFLNLKQKYHMFSKDKFYLVLFNNDINLKFYII